MNEQERRDEYFKLTGRISTLDRNGYFVFCKGIEYYQEICISICMNAAKRLRQEGCNHEATAIENVADEISDRK